MTHPPGFGEAFKRLSAERTAMALTKSLPRVWARDLHDEAIRSFLDRIKRGEKVAFVASPLKKNVYKTMWLERALLAEVKQAAADRNVSVATFVLTACLAYLDAQGIKLE